MRVLWAAHHTNLHVCRPFVLMAITNFSLKKQTAYLWFYSKIVVEFNYECLLRAI